MPESSRSPSTGGITRRRVLGIGAALGAGGLALPANVQKALVYPSPLPGQGQLSDIRHVVLLMQENRSFDHYFGALSGVRGYSDPQPQKLSTGRPVFCQPDMSNPDGYLLPYHLDSHRTAAQEIPSVSHSWSVQHQAWNGGAMDNWVNAHIASDGAVNGQYTMGYFTRDDIPFHYALADAFTICDNYHCAVMGPTHPNRYMWMTGTLDPDGVAGGPALDNDAPAGTYSWTTYAEELQAAGVSWRFYHESAGGATGLAPIASMKQFQAAASDTRSPLYRNGLAAVSTGQFEYDALNDKLPTVSWLFPPTASDEHPARLPAAGATYIAGKIAAIAANPRVWATTVLIVSYDENDGLFDHVAPPTPPAGTADELVTLNSPTGVAGGGLPIGLGFRVPCIIVSPWTTGGYVASEVFDHTSQLRLLERVTGVQASNISDWRRATVGDLTSAFRFSQPRGAPVLPDTQGAYNLAQHEIATFRLPGVPGSQQSMPGQEPGRRPQAS
jgi:phospholipase C